MLDREGSSRCRPPPPMGLKSFFAGVVAKFLSTRRRPVRAGRFTVSADSLDGAEVTIRVDSWGVPHITGDSIKDVYFALGWYQAKERLFQMELMRRLATGRLSELLGEDALPQDKLARALGFHVLGEEDCELLSEMETVLLDSFVQGINAFLGSSAFKKPVEMSFAGPSEVEPFTRGDVGAVLRLVSFQMCYGWLEQLLKHQIVERVGMEHAQELDIVHPKDCPFTIPGGSAINLDVAASIPPRKGSNCFAISGKKSATGKPILASDPHLEASLPSVWFEFHLTCERENLDVSGVGFPLNPGVFIGRNRFCAWGVTLSFCDVSDVCFERLNASQDQYEFDGVWHPLHLREEEIVVKGMTKPVTMVCRSTHRGPILPDVLEGPLALDRQVSLQAPFLMSLKELRESPRDESLLLERRPVQPMQDLQNSFIQTLLDLARSESVIDIVAASRTIHIVSLNVVCADIGGDIAYSLTGAIPVRHTDYSGNVVMDGVSPRCSWRGFIPFDRLPSQVNPPCGYIISANHQIFPQEKYPYSLGNIFLPGYRAKRIEDLITRRLQASGVITAEDAQSIMVDCLSMAFFALSDVLRGLNPEELEEKDRRLFDMLEDFDGIMAVDSAAASVYSVFRARLARNLWEEAVGKDLCDILLGREFGCGQLKTDHGYFGNDIDIILRLLKAKRSYLVFQNGCRQDLFAKCLQETRKYLRNRYGSNLAAAPWGRLHQLTFQHPIGNHVSFFNRGPFELPGDGDCVFNTHASDVTAFEVGCYIPSFRMCVDFGTGSAVGVLPPGQSGHRGTSNYDDQIDMWRTGVYRCMAFTEEEIGDILSGEIVLEAPASAK